jgi:hypothetical protein
MEEQQRLFFSNDENARKNFGPLQKALSKLLMMIRMP